MSLVVTVYPKVPFSSPSHVCPSETLDPLFSLSDVGFSVSSPLFFLYSTDLQRSFGATWWDRRGGQGFWNLRFVAGSFVEQLYPPLATPSFKGPSSLNGLTESGSVPLDHCERRFLPLRAFCDPLSYLGALGPCGKVLEEVCALSFRVCGGPRSGEGRSPRSGVHPRLLLCAPHPREPQLSSPLHPPTSTRRLLPPSLLLPLDVSPLVSPRDPKCRRGGGGGRWTSRGGSRPRGPALTCGPSRSRGVPAGTRGPRRPRPTRARARVGAGLGPLPGARRPEAPRPRETGGAPTGPSAREVRLRSFAPPPSVNPLKRGERTLKCPLCTRPLRPRASPSPPLKGEAERAAKPGARAARGPARLLRLRGERLRRGPVRRPWPGPRRPSRPSRPWATFSVPRGRSAAPGRNGTTKRRPYM